MEITPRAPSFTPVKITCATAGATILYRIGNNEQWFYSQEEIKSFINESPTEYDNIVNIVQVGDTMVLYAYAKKDGMVDSDAVGWNLTTGVIT